MTEWQEVLKRRKEHNEKRDKINELQCRMLDEQAKTSQKIRQLEAQLEKERKLNQMRMAAAVMPHPVQQRLPPIPNIQIQQHRQQPTPRANMTGFDRTTAMLSTGRGIARSWKGIR